jgi:Ca2+/Na+ antiporter
LKYTEWIYIGILAIIIATLFTFATADLNASMYVWIYGWAILCALYPVAHWLERRKKKPSEKPETQVKKTKTKKRRKSGF